MGSCTVDAAVHMLHCCGCGLSLDLALVSRLLPLRCYAAPADGATAGGLEFSDFFPNFTYRPPTATQAFV